MPPPAPRPAAAIRLSPWARSPAQTTPEEPAAPPAEDEEPPPSIALADGDDETSTQNLDVESPNEDEDGSSDPVDADATPNNDIQQPLPDEEDGVGGNTPSTNQPPMESATNADGEADPDSSEDGPPPNNYVHVLDPDSVQDLQGQEEHEADRRLKKVYGGDTVHRNDGRQLHGGVEGDAAMCMLYDNVVSHPHPMYSPPKGKVGQRFLNMFAAELRQVRERKSNSERALIFSAVVLRRESGIKRARDIKRRLTSRMDLWEAGKIAELVQDTVTTAKRGAGGARRAEDAESIARKFNSMVIAGKMRSGVRMLTQRNGGGVLCFDEEDTKTGRKVIDVLHDKHPDLRIPDLEQEDWASFEAYDECPTSIPVDCSQEIVAEVASKVSGGAGPSGVDGRSRRRLY